MFNVFFSVYPAGGGSVRRLVYSRIKIRKSLDDICHTLEADIPASEASKIHKHDAVVIHYQNPYITDNKSIRPVTTVLVDEITDNTDPDRQGLVVIARSPARDIIDSHWSGAIKGSQTLLYITETIAKEFNIAVAHFPRGIDETMPVKSFSWECESPWAQLLSEADNQGYLFTSNEVGGLYLWRPAKMLRIEGFALEEGRNIQKISATENGGDQFNKYVVKGAGREASITDSTCKNNRILTINLSDTNLSQQQLERRAKTEMLRRREKRIVITTRDWGLDDRQLQKLGNTAGKEVFWNPNFLIPVRAPSRELDGNFLVSQVEYTGENNAFTCDITVVSPEVYS